MSQNMQNRPHLLRGPEDLDWEGMERNFRHFEALIRDLKTEVEQLKAQVEALSTAEP